jgi:hypothetical protein
MTTQTYAVRDCTLLSRKAVYRISGETGLWQYSYEEFSGRHTYYAFWRVHEKNPEKRVTKRLSGEKVYEKVVELREEPPLTPMDLTTFESFRYQ